MIEEEINEKEEEIIDLHPDIIPVQSYNDIITQENVFRLSDISHNLGAVNVYSANGITIHYGADILLKEGGDIKFTSVTKPIACVATLVTTSTGNVDAGTHKYTITYINDSGETELGAVSNTITTDATHKQVTLSKIPVSTSISVTSRKIYRTKAGADEYYLLATIADNTTTTYTDNIADASLTGVDATYRGNNSFGKIIIDDNISFFLGDKNTFIGQFAGTSNPIGYYNTAIGRGALYSNTTGYQNTAIGHGALNDNEDGYENTGIGGSSLNNNTEGYRNTAIGYWSLAFGVEGYDNVAIGQKTFFSNTTGHENVGVGVEAGYANTSGFSNTTIGFEALTANTNGWGNTVLGYEAGHIVDGGDANTIIGMWAGKSMEDVGHNVFLGYAAGYYETGGSKLFIDNSSRTNEADGRVRALIYGEFASATANQKLTINGILRLSESKTPATSGADGAAGDICWDASYIYVCTSTDHWERASIGTW